MQLFTQKELTFNPGTTEKNYAKLLELDRMDDKSSFGVLPFSQAFTLWLQTHSPFISERTAKCYREYGAAFVAFYGEKPVQQIGRFGVRAFQLWRLRDGENEPDGYAHNAAAVRIRNEINGVLKPMLKEAGLWAEIKEQGFKHLPVPRDGAGTLINRDEQREILNVAFSQPKWNLAAHALKIMFHTGAGFGELRKLRRRDVDLEARTMRIVLGAKNSGPRVRTVALVPSALSSMTWLIRRWDRKGGIDRNDYILPHRRLLRAGNGFATPMASINRAWMAIRAEWIHCHPNRQAKARLRLYDARVTAAIRLLQNGKLSLPTIKKALGWAPSSAMIDRYYKPEHDMLRDALSTLEDTDATN